MITEADVRAILICLLMAGLIVHLDSIWFVIFVLFVGWIAMWATYI